jgi:hypothetical protein
MNISRRLFHRFFSIIIIIIYNLSIWQLYIFLDNLVVSYGKAFIFSIAFESPFMGLEKIIFSSRSKKEAKERMRDFLMSHNLCLSKFRILFTF